VWELNQIKDLHLQIVAPRNLFIEFIHEVRSATRLPTERTENVGSLCSLLKILGTRLNGGVQIEQRN